MTYVDKTVDPGHDLPVPRARDRPDGQPGHRCLDDGHRGDHRTSRRDYSLAVLDDGAIHYWPLDEASGTTGADWTGDERPHRDRRDARRRRAEPRDADDGDPVRGHVELVRRRRPTDESGPNTLTVEAWFKTTSTQRRQDRRLRQQVDAAARRSYDRAIYLDNSGRVTFGVYPGAYRTITSGTGFNNGQWHHVVGTLSPSGMSLYVDGVRIGTRADTTSAQTYNGYWRVGGDTVGSWPNAGSIALPERRDRRCRDLQHRRSPAPRSTRTGWRRAAARRSPPAPADAYGKAIYDLAPTLYWRLGESSGLGRGRLRPRRADRHVLRQRDEGRRGRADRRLEHRGVARADEELFGQWTQTGITSDKHYTNPTTFSVEGVVQDQHDDRRQDHRLRQLPHRYERQLRPSHLHDGRRQGELRRLQRLAGGRHQPGALQRQPVAPRRRSAVAPAACSSTSTAR